MRNIFVCIAISVFFLVLNPENSIGQGGDFLSAIHDVPLPSGLYEIREETLEFDKPSGRIISSLAVSDSLRPDMIYDFYDMTLPQLGWKKQAIGIYQRDSEELGLNAWQSKDVTIVKYTLTP